MEIFKGFIRPVGDKIRKFPRLFLATIQSFATLEEEKPTTYERMRETSFGINDGSMVGYTPFIVDTDWGGAAGDETARGWAALQKSLGEISGEDQGEVEN